MDGPLSRVCLPLREYDSDEVWLGMGRSWGNSETRTGLAHSVG